MYHIHSEGSPKERGRAHGRQAVERITGLVEHYRVSRLANGIVQVDFGSDSNQRTVDRIIERLHRVYPEACEEMEGIAEGAGLRFEDICALNLTCEMAPSACSVYGFADGHGSVWLGKSDDLPQAELGTNAVHFTIPEEAIPSVQMHFVGTLWTTSAVNAEGFCLGMTGLSGRKVDEQGWPTLLLLHHLAERCGTVVEAEEICLAFGIRSGGMSILMGDAQGDVAILETHVEGQAIRRPDRRRQAVWQTNHCCSQSLAAVDDPQNPLLPNSRERMECLTRLDPTVERSMAGLCRLFRTHDAPAGICQHGEGGLHTDSAIILSPQQQTLWATAGAPCTHSFVSYELVL